MLIFVETKPIPSLFQLNFIKRPYIRTNKLKNILYHMFVDFIGYVIGNIVFLYLVKNCFLSLFVHK